MDAVNVLSVAAAATVATTSAIERTQEEKERLCKAGRLLSIGFNSTTV
jgi:hypothetical protein